MPRPASAGGERPGAPGRWHPLVLVPLALAVWVYHPILRVNFFADDLAHLASIESGSVLDFLLAPFGGHNLLARNLTFLATWRLFGLHAPLFFATVLLTHLLNVALLFDVMRRMTGSSRLACFGAALWGTSPLCLGTLGWYSVYGQALVATILLAVLRRVVRLAPADTPPSPSEACLWYGLVLVGTTCFGTGIGVALVFPVVLFLLLPAAWSNPRQRLAWLLLPVVSLGLYFAFRRLYPLVGTLTFTEKLQERIALDGLGAAPPMLLQLLVHAVAETALGPVLATDYPAMAAWVVVLAFAGGCALLLARGGPATRRQAVAMAALAIGVYLVIAVGRGHAYAMFKRSPQTAARVARYHYVGSIPTAALLCLILQQVGRLPGLHRIPAPLALAAGLAAIVAGPMLVGRPIEEYRRSKDYVQRAGDAITASVRGAPAGSTVYIENDRTPFAVLGPALPQAVFPGRAGVFVLLHPSDQLEGRTVRFVERNQDTLDYYAVRPDTRLARLLVAPEQVPAQP